MRPRAARLTLAAALGLTTLVVALAVLQARGWNGSVNADGVSYLDLARQYANGDIGAITNGYWSPLYPLLLGVVQGGARLLGAGAPEMLLVLATNLVIFAAATLSVVRLARVLASSPARDATPASGAVVLARGLAAGALCIWMLLRMITATAITPDALLTIWLFLASADIVEAGTEEPSVRRHLRFGAVLALGYWTKAVFLPVALVALVAYVVATPKAWRRRATTRALIPLMLIALPLVAVQSWTQGRPSFGETGRLNYRWYVGNLPHAPPLHERVEETRKRVQRGEAAAVALASAPGGVLFTGAPAGSFAYWYDASRYEPRAGAPFSLRAQWDVVVFNAHWFRVTAGTFALFAVVGAAAAAGRATVRPRRLLAMLPAATMLALYAMTHPEGRLGAPAIACLLLVVVHLADAGPPGRRRPLLVVECIALVLLSVVALGRTAKRIPTGAVTARAPAPSAASLRAAGVAPGASIALAGSAFGQLWAHEADVHIVAVLPAADSLSGAGEPAFRTLMAEAAARGTPLDAVVWSGGAVRTVDAVPLATGWWALRPGAPAATGLAEPRPRPRTPRAAPPVGAPRRAPGPAARP